MVVMPSDHVIKDDAKFVEAVRRAAEVARNRPARAVRHQADRAAHRLRLHPPGRRARGLQRRRLPGARVRREARPQDGGEVSRRRRLLLEQRHLRAARRAPSSTSWRGCEPQVLEAARGGLAKAEEDLGFLRLDKASFAAAPSISIDYAVMEKTELAAMLPIDVGWNDIGSWSSLWDVAPHDADGNFVNGDSDPGRHPQLLRPQRARPRLDHRRRQPDHRRYARRAAGRGQVARPGRVDDRRPAQAVEPQGAGAAPAELPALGLLRDAVDRRPLPGQAAARQARRQALHADAPSPLRALGRRAGHRQGRGRRHREARARERERLHLRRRSGTAWRTPARFRSS